MPDDRDDILKGARKIPMYATWSDAAILREADKSPDIAMRFSQSAEKPVPTAYIDSTGRNLGVFTDPIPPEGKKPFVRSMQLTEYDESKAAEEDADKAFDIGVKRVFAGEPNSWERFGSLLGLDTSEYTQEDFENALRDRDVHKAVQNVLAARRRNLPK